MGDKPLGTVMLKAEFHKQLNDAWNTHVVRKNTSLGMYLATSYRKENKRLD